MRRLALPLALMVPLALPQAAAAAVRQIIRGAGFGHGIGMSQYGAYGFAKHGYDYKQILAHYYQGTDLSKAGSADIRVLLQTGSRTATFSGATDGGGHKLNPSKTYRVKLSELRRAAATQRPRDERRKRRPLPRFARVPAEPVQRPRGGECGEPRRLREGR